MKAQKFLLPVLLVVFAAFSVSTTFAQDSHELKRTGLTKFSVGTQKFSFRDANKYIGDAEIVNRINKGITLEKTAIGLGVSGAVIFSAGVPMAFYGWLDFGNHRYDFMNGAGFTMMILGSAMGAVSIGLGITGAVTVKKAVKRYNSGAGLHSELRLGMAATPGGLGMQLTF